MKLEDRLSAHFKAAGEQIHGPELPFATLASHSAGRGWWAQSLTAIGVLVGLGALGFGALQLGILGSIAESETEHEPTQVVVSPFVDVNSRLTGLADTELFTVTADQPSYWRTATLDTYGDEIWNLAGNFDDVQGALPGRSLNDESATLITQLVEVKALGSIWLPVAPEPVVAIAEAGNLTWNADAASLAVSSRLPDGDGLVYEVTSSRPNLSAEDLQDATGEDPVAITERYLRYRPGVDLSASAGLLAEEITAGATTRYDRAIALQGYFRDFSYDLDAAGGEQNPVDDFLSDEAGIARQFSSAFALMGRHLEIPTRVAVGFTWGVPVADDPAADDSLPPGTTRYSVQGRHTHSWPEVYFPDIGWVPFEPTPGRGIPGAVAYTGIAAEQVHPDQETD